MSQQKQTLVRQFLVNTSHYMGGNTYRYDFPQGRTLQLDSNAQIALTSISMFNSTFNIKESWNNNKLIIFSSQFNLTALTSAGFINGQTYTDPLTNLVISQRYVQITIPDGYFDIASIELYLQQQFQLMGFYFQSSDGQSNMYFMECLTNPQRYKAQINLFTIPTSLPSGFVMPSNSCFTLPTTKTSPRLYFPSVSLNSKYGNLGRIFGFNQDTILPLSNNVNLDSDNLSQKCPTVSPITTYIVCCNLVDNSLTNPSDVLMQLNLGSSKFGGAVPFTDFPQYISCNPQQASSITITLFDEYFEALQHQDPQFSLILSVKTEKT